MTRGVTKQCLVSAVVLMRGKKSVASPFFGYTRFRETPADVFFVCFFNGNPIWKSRGCKSWGVFSIYNQLFFAEVKKLQDDKISGYLNWLSELVLFPLPSACRMVSSFTCNANWIMNYDEALH